ncbi:MAG: sialate O-acetylesterase [Chthoniobacteraceae bacterium]
MNRILPALLALAPVVCAMLPCRADVTLPSLFSDNMVIQQHEKINVWGKADPDESVTVQMGPDTAQTTAGKDGNWEVKLDGLKSGGPYDMTVFGKNSVTVHNVAIGEVWVCAGESNMEFKTIEARNGQDESVDGDLPMVRVFTVWHNAADEPQSDCDGAWVVCDPNTARNFSAIGFFFARELNRAMRVPIGLIQCTWGGSPIEAWMPRATLEEDPDFLAELDHYNKAAAAYPQAKAAYDAKLVDWKSAADAAKSAGSPPTPRPVAPLAPGGARQPAALYDGMIAPLTRYPICGVLWYQGESNTSHPSLYRKLLPAMITSWREGWDEGDFPFFYAQLSNFLAPRPEPGESRWAELREAQSLALDVPKTGMVVTADVGEPDNMHPPDKQDVAHRFALLAKNEVYGEPDLTTSGPVFSGMRIEDGKAILSFDHADGGLIAKGGKPLKGFQIAPDGGPFVWAGAQISDDQVIVQSKDVPNPTAVRYAWADYPDCTLFNKGGLPAIPFRTDTQGAPSPTPSPSPTKRRKHHADD